MAVQTIEATIENGQLRLPKNLRLPQRAKVTVLINDQDEEEGEIIQVPPLPSVVHFRSLRFASPEDAARLPKVVMQD